MWSTPAYLVMLLGAATWPTYASPGKGDTHAVTTTSSGHAALATKTESMILALQGKDEWLANGKTKWLTYFVSDGKDPNWCDGANAKKKLKSGDGTNLPPSINYDTDPGDTFLQGCKYDSSGYTFKCAHWSATCTVNKGKDSDGFPVNGKDVKTCDGLPVKELVVCKQDEGSPALLTTATGRSTATASTTTATGVTQPKYTAACIQGMRNATTWADYKMAEFLKDEADSIPEDYEGTFVDWLASKADGIGKFECDFNTADNKPCVQDLDPEICKKGSNPRYYYALYSIINFHTWVTDISSAVRDARNEFAATSSHITADFIRTTLPDPNMTWIAVLFAGLFGALSGLSAAWMAAVPAMSSLLVTSGVSGAASGASTIGNGIHNGLLSSAEDVIQNELNALNHLQDFTSHQMNAMLDAITYWGRNVTLGTVKNDVKNHIFYQNDAKGIVSTLKDGLFADDDVGTKDTYAVNNAMLKAMWSGSIGFLWQSQRVFIVKLSTRMENDKHVHHPCSDDFPLKAYHRSLVRVCEGDTAYFFIIKADIIRSNYDWPEIYGADDDTLEQYSLDLLTLAKGAEWTQKTFGFGANFENSTSQAIADEYLNAKDPGKVPKNVFMSVPVCDLDWLKDNGPYPWGGKIHYNGVEGMGDELKMFRYLVSQGCGSMEVEVNGKTQKWPYAGFKKHSVSLRDG